MMPSQVTCAYYVTVLFIRKQIPISSTKTVLKRGFITTICAGSARGSKKDKGFMFEKPIDLKIGVNHLALLSSSMGMKVISDCFGS
jgi:hypothetical protein